MQIFGMICFCYIQNKTKLDPCCEKGIFFGYDKQSPAYMVYFQGTMAIKRVRCVKFIDSYDNSLLLKPDNTEKSRILNHTWHRTERQSKHQREGQITCYPMWQRKRQFFL